MKRLLALIVALGSLGVATGAWAEPANSGALELGDHQVGTESMVMQDDNRMTTVTSDVNDEQPATVEQQDSSAPPQQQQGQPRLLPEGMVVRSSQFGGVSVGVEF